MFSLGSQEILILVILALLLFGPDKIPEIARTINRFTREFNKYKSIMESTIRQEIYSAEGPRPETMSMADRMDKAAGASAALIAEQNAASAAVALEAPDAATEDGDEEVAVAPAVKAPPMKAAAPAPTAALADDSDEEEQG
jgi:Sec-independent protein translocase protein TatA